MKKWKLLGPKRMDAENAMMKKNGARLKAWAKSSPILRGTLDLKKSPS
ncbi:hypothetical protein PF003_g15883 [Phytophthora fragariae]|nr:hypothetical protein PF003_g15883 [Phytophthora fragariae]